MTELLLFYVFAAVALGGGVGVVIGKSPIASLLSMVTTLASISGIYVLFEAHFLAAVQVIVYAGAIMVLFLFVIMLLNLGHDYRADIKSFLWSLIASVVTGITAGILAVRFVGGENDAFFDRFEAASAIDDAILEAGAVGAIAEPLFTDYVVAFEVTGLLLLVAIVAAVVLAKPGSGARK